MSSPPNASRRLQTWFALSALAFVAAAGLVVEGRRTFFNWFLLVGTFGNMMTFRALLKRRPLNSRDDG